MGHAPSQLMIGILLIDKPRGITSHDAVARVRRIFNTKRVGHAGTLDPLADGLLVAAVGSATRFLNYLELEPKKYIAEVKFGQETTTYDAEGSIVCSSPVPEDLDEKLSSALPEFLGEICQMPPLYSAVKKDGRPLYDYARRGDSIEIQPRRIIVHDVQITSSSQPEVRRVEVTCGGGTYIRSLAHDLGQAVGCGGHIIALRRTAAGKFSVDQAKPLDEISCDDLLPLPQALSHLEQVQLEEREEADIRQGRRICLPGIEPTLLLCSQSGEVVALAKRVGEELQPACVIPKHPSV